MVDLTWTIRRTTVWGFTIFYDSEHNALVLTARFRMMVPAKVKLSLDRKTNDDIPQIFQ